MKNGESEFKVKFGVTPFFDVPKIEHRRFLAFPFNKKRFWPVLGQMKNGESEFEVKFGVTPFFIFQK